MPVSESKSYSMRRDGRLVVDAKLLFASERVKRDLKTLSRKVRARSSGDTTVGQQKAPAPVGAE